MWGYTLACLQLALAVAAVPREGSPKLYVCQSGQCVVNSRGLPLAECEAACKPLPPANYTCRGGQCVVSPRGLPKAECDQVCGGPAPPPASPNIVQLTESTPDLSTLIEALKAGNLTGALSGPGPFTVFAPTNEAFSALPPTTLKSLLDPENVLQLQALLEYHVIAGPAKYSKQLANHERIRTLEGQSIEITLLSGSVFVDRSRVVKADNTASNGVVHIIDKVLQPLDPIPPSPGPPPPPPTPGMRSIIELAESASTLTFLTTLLKSAELTKTLSGRGPFTVFAPTNDVFASLPYPYAASLLDPANLTDVQKLLGFHVVPGIYYPEDLINGLQIKTLEGDPLEAVHFNSHGDWQIDGIYIGNPPPKSGDFIPRGDIKLTGRSTNPPVNASNGVVYIVNGLLVPPGANPIPPQDHPRPTPYDQETILRACNNKSCLFSFTNKPGGCCGEVNAAPRMPPSIWADPSAVVEYVRLTTAFSNAVPKTLPRYEPCFSPGNAHAVCSPYELVTLGSCTDSEFHRNWVHDGNRSIDWSAGFGNWCKARCDCGIPGTALHAQQPCKDAPDDPTTHRYCSLCGPKYNAPIAVQLYHPNGGSSSKCLGV